MSCASKRNSVGQAYTSTNRLGRIAHKTVMRCVPRMAFLPSALTVARSLAVLFAIQRAIACSGLQTLKNGQPGRPKTLLFFQFFRPVAMNHFRDLG
jgi:hypothetical protein